MNPAEAGTPRSRVETALPYAVFGAVCLVALVTIPYLARRQWFFNDDWDFLAARTAGNLGDLFRPHNVHWSTLPILAYRGLWQLFGLRHYMPYLLGDVVLHVTLAILLFVMMRKCGVRRVARDGGGLAVRALRKWIPKYRPRVSDRFRRHIGVRLRATHPREPR